ncbi:S41 family peptidase [Candidatus Galacturonibacter soehngenii]|uniref:S41 family peptidase n=1 Tax=Candidatus Galacturonatibacter soehngenii TaxID=2307010 RepID=A0A7V7QHJ3_9FIRM|nr:S41 family peptidase [Candidatus Galacturonibacter soehngenii]KAB1434415.1 S41 family peptidase [Candidatus Galacturonibacter soehngenii]
MEDNKKFIKGFLGGLFTATCVLAIVVFIYKYTDLDVNLSRASLVSNTSNDADTKEVGSKAVDSKISVIKQIIDKYYLEEVHETDLVEGMYKGLVDGLGDPYSVYYTKDEFQSLMESTNGVYCGIGVTVSQDANTGIITLVKPFENSPGLKAGILPGDILYMVDDTEVTGMELSSVVAMIKGEEGTTVNLTIIREGERDNIELTVERQQIEIPTISYEVLKNNIGYINISEFDTVTQPQFINALEDLKNQGIAGLIVDLRNNPGGNLDVVNNILDQILPEGMIVYTEDKYGNKEEYKSDEEHQFTKPLAVLINGNSASASEIFAGAVKDYGIGTLVGTKTFGKGIVQRLIELGDGTAMKLTISKYYTPNGYNIHKIGIEPDVLIELDEALKMQAIITHDEDNQLQKAIEIIEEKLH